MSRRATVYRCATHLPTEGLVLNVMVIFGSEDIFCLYRKSSDCFRVRLGRGTLLATGQHQKSTSCKWGRILSETALWPGVLSQRVRERPPPTGLVRVLYHVPADQIRPSGASGRLASGLLQVACVARPRSSPRVVRAVRHGRRGEPRDTSRRSHTRRAACTFPALADRDPTSRDLDHLRSRGCFRRSG